MTTYCTKQNKYKISTKNANTAHRASLHSTYLQYNRLELRLPMVLPKARLVQAYWW